MYKRMKERGSASHPSRNAVREVFDSFDVEGPDKQHQCPVHPPLGECANFPSPKPRDEAPCASTKSRLI
ncbi:hypothetical protein F5X97DRAFT_288130 [Nemania serpens]|nr:hypothetical protein F5X97DRAFT_288130 [Nemania serpens]